MKKFVRSTVLTVLTLSSLPGTSQAFEDTLNHRLNACTSFHGDQGRAGPDGYYPRLAGKPAGYLFNQLVNFRDGRRHYGPMTGMIDRLSEAYLHEIARHFAMQDVPYPAPVAHPISQAQRERGALLALQGDPQARLPACIACHGQALTGVAPAVPGLLGLPRDYLNAQLGAWKSGQRSARSPDCMAEVASRLAPQDIAAITSWLAAQPVPTPSRPVTALPKPMPLECGGASARASAPGTLP